jgi:DNA-binding NarL/FixJ family response regulator
MVQYIRALIIAPPGLLREGLLAALGTLHSIEVVGQADTVSQAMVVEHEPAFVLFSIEGPEHNNLAALQKIKAQWPAVRCIALVDTVAQQQAALAIGAEEVLIKGVRPQVLLAKIEQLLSNEKLVHAEGVTPGG